MQIPLQRQANFTIYALSENAVTLQFGQSISEETLHNINAYNMLLGKQPFPGMQATVPAYATLSVFYNVLQVMQSDLPGKFCYDKVAGYLQSLQPEPTYQAKSYHKVTIPVCYGGDFGPDLEDVAHVNNITVEEVIKLHTAATYKVFMIGFVPGFAYLGGMDANLITPRKTTPRKAVPAGSVGIAGEQTGVYPMETPGGWQIIGQTPHNLFDAKRSEPALLKAGDEVKFEPISYTQFQTCLP
jgi:inhibitor of KinA